MKSIRQKKILELIRVCHIETQEELTARLRDEGFQVTQATVSRDIRALNLSKIPDREGRLRYAVLQEPGISGGRGALHTMANAILSVAEGQNLLVIRTTPGMAQGIAAILDSLEWKEILGSIAGDDTIMCACATVEDAAIVGDRVRALTL